MRRESWLGAGGGFELSDCRPITVGTASRGTAAAARASPHRRRRRREAEQPVQAYVQNNFAAVVRNTPAISFFAIGRERNAL